MVEIASEKGISHPTVSRRIEAGLNQLRKALRRRGVAVAAAAALSSLLMENAAQAAPVTVVAQLAKISLLGAHTAAGSISPTLTNPVFSTARSVMTGLNAISTTKIMAVSACGALVLTGAISYWYISPSSRPSKPPMIPEPLSQTTNNAPQPPNEQDPPQNQILQQQSTEQPNPPIIDEPTQVHEPVEPNPEEELVEQPQSIEEPQPTQEFQQDKLDLSSPEGTVKSFTRMFVEGDVDSVLACFLPGGTDYEDIEEVLAAAPDDSEYGFKLLFQSLDPDAEMPIVEMEETLAGTNVVWLVTFKRDFSIQGTDFPAGSQMDLDATLVECDGKWLIDNF